MVTISRKLRHTTGAYLHMHDAPTEEDVIFYLASQKHKSADFNALVKAFGEHKVDKIEATLRSLNARMAITRLGDQHQIITLTKI